MPSSRTSFRVVVQICSRADLCNGNLSDVILDGSKYIVRIVAEEGVVLIARIVGEVVLGPQRGVADIESEVIPDHLLTVGRALCIGYKVRCKFRILALVCNDSTCTADTYGALLACFEYRALCDVPVAFFLRHVVDESGHIPHSLGEGNDVAVEDVLETGFEIDTS